MTTTFRIPMTLLVLATSVAVSVTLVTASSVASDTPEPALQAGGELDGKQSCSRDFANAFPTAEAGFAMRRPVVGT